VLHLLRLFLVPIPIRERVSRLFRTGCVTSSEKTKKSTIRAGEERRSPNEKIATKQKTLLEELGTVWDWPDMPGLKKGMERVIAGRKSASVCNKSHPSLIRNNGKNKTVFLRTRSQETG